MALTPRSSSSPTPISWPPSQSWDGDDGSWSSFALRVGSTEQIVRVLISTAGSNSWVITPGGCIPGVSSGFTPSSTCHQDRGELFDPSLSNTWSGLGNYSLGTEDNLGYDAPATYGLDTLALGFSNATGGPTLRSQVIAGIQSYFYYTGVFGLSNQPSNFTASDDANNLTDTIPYPSFLSSMKNQSLIPSLSWAYTAGATYQEKGVFGSLTFGGYDSSRLIPNDITFSMAPDISRDLVVGLQSITSTTANGSKVSLLPNSILTFIDSTLPFIWLPLEACTAFENAFGLTYNITDRLYAVNDTLHQSLTARNPSVTFEIGNSQTGGPTVKITLPYASFDLNVSFPRVDNPTRYFPLKRAANETQYTLGRTFLQEAYLIANYEFSNFSVSQARYEDGLPQNLIALPSADPPPAPKTHGRLSRSSIIGLSIGLVAFLVLLVSLLVYFRRKRSRRHSPKDDSSTDKVSPRISMDVKHIPGVHEADNNSLYLKRELPDSGKLELLDQASPSGSGNEISEMPQSPSPTPLCELGTRHTSLANSSLRRQSDRNRTAIFVSTGMYRRESSDSTGALKGSSYVETRITSSPRRTPQESAGSSPTPSQLTPEYLDRKALPSLPTSSSTRDSLAKPGSSSPGSATNGAQSLSSRTSITSCEPGAAPPDTALDITWQDYDMSWESQRRAEPSLWSSCSTDIKIMFPPEVANRPMREHPSMSSLAPSTDVALVAPPGTPKSPMPNSAGGRGGERKPRGNFF